MDYSFISASGEETAIRYMADGMVEYSAGGRKTKFSLDSCQDYVFEYGDGTSRKLVCGKNGVDRTHLIILHGEDRLEKNNDKSETRKHDSLDDYRDKHVEMADTGTDTEADVISGIEKSELREAVGKLKPTEQELVLRMYLADKSVNREEYAAEIGLTANSLMKKAMRIRRKLQAFLNG